MIKCFNSSTTKLKIHFFSSVDERVRITQVEVIGMKVWLMSSFTVALHNPQPAAVYLFAIYIKIGTFRTGCRPPPCGITQPRRGAVESIR